MAPIKQRIYPPGPDDHMVIIKLESTDKWLADMNYNTRMSRWNRGCNPETGEKVSEDELVVDDEGYRVNPFPEPAWRPTDWEKPSFYSK